MEFVVRQTVLCCLTFFNEESKISPVIAERAHGLFKSILSIVTANFTDVKLMDKFKVCAHTQSVELKNQLEAEVELMLRESSMLYEEVVKYLKHLSEFGRILPHDGNNQSVKQKISIQEQIDLLLISLKDYQNIRAKKTGRKLKIVLSFRVDNLHRLRNLLSSILNIYQQKGCQNDIYLVAVCQDSMDEYGHLIRPLVDQYIFFENPRSFNYAKGRNIGVRESPLSDLVCFWDVDMIAPPTMIRSILDSDWKKVGCVIPYDKLLNLDEKSTEKHCKSLLKSSYSDTYDGFSGQIMYEIYGGIIVVKNSVFQSINGQDERFIGWGDEDNNFYFRVYEITDVLRLRLSLFHYNHPRPNMNNNNKKLNKNFLQGQ